MMGHKLECPDATSTSPVPWLFPYWEFDSHATVYLCLQSQFCHKSLAQPFTNKWTNKGSSKNSTGFSNWLLPNNQSDTQEFDGCITSANQKMSYFLDDS
jgi:hypothetical protein